MKTFRLLSISSVAVLLLFVACTADEIHDLPASSAQTPVTSGITPPSLSNTNRIAESIACGRYNIALESVTRVANKWEWVWSVQNLNPGNGQNGTTQDLSNWGMQFGSCVAPSSLVGAAVSSDGVNWTSIPLEYGPSPSSCLIGILLKFDYGTTGNALSYYKVIVNQEYIVSYLPGYYRSGTVTGCCIFNFNGIGCPTGTDE